MRLTAILLIASATALAQQPVVENGKQAFEVASIKPNASGSNTSTENTAPGRFNASNVTIAELIQSRSASETFRLPEVRGGYATTAIT